MNWVAATCLTLVAIFVFGLVGWCFLTVILNPP